MEAHNRTDQVHLVNEKPKEELTVTELLQQLEMKGHKVKLMEGSSP